MFKNPFEDLSKEKNWGGVMIFGAFLIVIGIWTTFKDQLVIGQSDEKSRRAEVDSLHRYYQGKLDAQNLKIEAVTTQANARVDRANARTDSVIKVQIQEKSDLIALFTAKFGPVESLVENNRRKTRNLEKKVDNAATLANDIKQEAKKERPNE